MTSTLGFSSFNDSDNTLSKSRFKKNKTLKKKSKKVTTFLKSMEEDDDNLADFDSSFNPPAQPELTRQPEPVKENKLKPKCRFCLSGSSYGQFSKLQGKITGLLPANSHKLIVHILHLPVHSP